MRAQPDALARARQATELIAVYQQRSTELARLRRLAIEQVARQRGMTMAAVAAELGLSKGRISQIRQGGPPPERGLFGVGPITVAVPTREMPGRGLPVISAEDSIAAERITSLLAGLGFTVDQYRIPIGGQWTPTGDVLAICGPKSSPVTIEVLTSDPLLTFTEDSAGRWGIQDRATGQRWLSPMDDPEPGEADIAYVGRLPYRDGALFLIAGVHAIGSVGAVHHLAAHLSDLYEAVGEGYWSGVVLSRHRAEAIGESEWLCPPRKH